MNFYTNCTVLGNKIAYRGVEGTKRVSKRMDYSPSFFIHNTKNNKSKFHTLYDQPLEKLSFSDIAEAKSFLKSYDGVENFSIYGNDRYNYCYLSDLYPTKVDYDLNLIRIAYLDIETKSDNGFPQPDLAIEPVIAITVKIGNISNVFGLGSFYTTDENIKYVACQSEEELLRSFINFWSSDYPDIVTGWNTTFFDVPYLVNRINSVLGPNESKKLSPWKWFSERKVNIMGRQQSQFILAGISSLDYMDLYKKLAPNYSQESYKLDHIAHVELDERKLAYDGTLNDLYKVDFQKFIEYNIKDVYLVERLEKKLKLIELVLTLAYHAKINYDDVLSQVRMWDVLIFNELRKRHIAVPQNDRSSMYGGTYAGGYVKEPIVGMHRWVISYDANSLYPSILRLLNISPETIVEGAPLSYSVDHLLHSFPELDLEDQNVCFAVNGHKFSKNKKGFISDLIEKMYRDRVTAKNEMLKKQQDREVVLRNIKKSPTPELLELERSLSYEISSLHNLQLATKITLNSCYGALGNRWFRYYDVRLAEAVTLTGQYIIRQLEKDVNGLMNKLCGTTDEDYVIAVDTDSLYVSFEKVVAKNPALQNSTTEQIISILDKLSRKMVEPQIDLFCQNISKQLNCMSNVLAMKREKIASSAIWTSKKRYILQVYDSEGVRYNKPKMKISGIEAIKSSTPAICKEAIKESIGIILSEKEKDLSKFVNSFKQKFESANPDDIAFPRSVNDLMKYTSSLGTPTKGCPQHVRAAIVYNKFLKDNKLVKEFRSIHDGDKIKYVHLLLPNPLHEEVIAFVDTFPDQLKSYVDKELQFEKTFIQPLKIISNAIGWNINNVASLEDFFN
jgi:DNA polymerase elongation subunit (family B)